MFHINFDYTLRFFCKIHFLNTISGTEVRYRHTPNPVTHQSLKYILSFIQQDYHVMKEIESSSDVELFEVLNDIKLHNKKLEFVS